MTCGFCKQECERTGRNQKYCSPGCASRGRYYSDLEKSRATSRRNRKKRPKPQPRPCQVCGAEFLPKKDNDVRYCGMPCMKKAWYAERPGYQAARASRRRSLRASNPQGVCPPNTKVILMEILGADYCLKCGSRDYVQIDHVIPVTLGGPECVTNFQFLCRLCNIRKLNRSCDDYRTYEQMKAAFDYVAANQP